MSSMILTQFGPFIESISGITDQSNDVFENAAKAFSMFTRSDVYKALDEIPFSDDAMLPIPPTIYTKPSHDSYYYIDALNRVRRKTYQGPDDVYVPNCSIVELLEPHETLTSYGRLSEAIENRAKDGDSQARIATTYGRIAESQARQIKAPLEKFVLALLVAEAGGSLYDPVLQKYDEIPDLSHNCPLWCFREICRHISGPLPDRAPYLYLSAGVFWLMSPRMTSAIPPLLSDLVNLAILQQTAGLDPSLVKLGVQICLHAAASSSYAWFILKTKSIFPQNTLHSMYESLEGGYCPNLEWLEPRSDYKFMYMGVMPLSTKYARSAPSNDKKARELGEKYGLSSVVSELRRRTKTYVKHDFASVRYIRDAMACTSGIFLVRTPTETVLQEYTQSPEIKVPIPQKDWTGPIGEIRVLKDTTSSIARYLYRTWYLAAARMAAQPRTWDPLFQAIMRSQYVTARGGSGAALRESLYAINVSLPDFKGLPVKAATKIFQAAQLANLPFSYTSVAILADTSMGLRNQVQRRPRSIMPLNVPQQQVSAPHTLTADYINYHMNLSTTSGSAVIEKVIPLGVYASSPPNQSINIDISACDASITWDFFLSVIMAAIHEGVASSSIGKPFMGVPASIVNDESVVGVRAARPISGMQNMIQHLSKLYKRGFSYRVNDSFSPGNDFTHMTTTFPSGSTATSTEHTANNSTMMETFLTVWGPEHTDDPDVLHLMKSLTIQRNYVCQGDDGLMIIDGNTAGKVNSETIQKMLELISKYGEEFGWKYDIAYDGTAEYLKLYFIFGCRIPNLSRHPIVGKERANSSAEEPWPAILDQIMGIFFNGVHDGLQWQRWIRYSWALCCAFSRQRTMIGESVGYLQYPMWSFVYWGLPLVKVFGSDPWIFSWYMPTGDLGMYSWISLIRPLMTRWMVANGYVTDRCSPVFGNADYRRCFNDLKLYQGYYMAQLPRNPKKSGRAAPREVREQFTQALSDYLMQNPELKSRVLRGRSEWEKYGAGIIHNPPSLFDVPHKWYQGAQEAATATREELAEMDEMLMRARRHSYSSFSKLLEAYLLVKWRMCEAREPSVDLRLPLCAGIDPLNSDPFLKMVSVGPMLQSTRKYFAQTLFMAKTVSGLDVNAIDSALLRLRTLGADKKALTAQLLMVGLQESEADALAGKIMLQDVNTVQLARVVNLAVPDTWMSLDFDTMFKHHVKLLPKDGRHLNTDIPPRMGWLRAILRFLGAGMVMTATGVAVDIYLEDIHGGGRSLGQRFMTWMRQEGRSA
uniref:RNA-directed RNA polymerase n=8 Tax=Mammalian orthoreovirus TaxID=351073 RepID=A0A0P0ID15_9REOV|nr:lambda-3 [Mammalian orthoreovirus]ALK02214.1 lambda-3 [Mammalian orthoreovirus]